VFRELKAGKTVPLTIYQPVNAGNPLKEDGSPTLFGGEYRLVGEISLVDQKPASISVLVNDKPTILPAIHAHGKFLWDEGDFYFLDDETNPISLKFSIGNAAHPNRDNLLVIKINYDCASGPLPAPQQTAIEKELTDTGKADVYSIYFAFGSDVIKDESEPTLKNIAEVLRRHSDWKLQVNGHTDAVGGDQYNLDLSRRRAAAVKDSLVKRYAIDAGRLTTQGYGKTQPKDTNDTIEGRARNRRVELIRPR
jgi:outer membrane protein OmpA-like peptidoglycan-associated protein